jgi:flagellar biosynthesis chaperone FliJ
VKRFRFRLKRVLQHREREEASAKEALVAARAELTRLQEVKAHFESELLRESNEGSILELESLYRLGLRSRITVKIQEIEHQMREVEALLLSYQSRYRESESLRILEKDQRVRHEKEQSRKEAEEQLESILLRHDVRKYTV